MSDKRDKGPDQKESVSLDDVSYAPLTRRSFIKAGIAAAASTQYIIDRWSPHVDPRSEFPQDTGIDSGLRDCEWHADVGPVAEHALRTAGTESVRSRLPESPRRYQSRHECRHSGRNAAAWRRVHAGAWGHNQLLMPMPVGGSVEVSRT